MSVIRLPGVVVRVDDTTAFKVRAVGADEARTVVVDRITLDTDGSTVLEREDGWLLLPALDAARLGRAMLNAALHSEPASRPALPEDEPGR